MRTIFVLFDSLNRSALGCYGAELGLTPNMDRFAAKSVIFDRHYVGGLPCMPARRDIHTGRLTFMHRAWGPLEPFDNSFARCLGRNGTYTHLISDHAHYFEDGGAGYATAYETWDFIRGQEGDPWIAMVQPPIERLRERYGTVHYPFDKVVPESFTKATTPTVAWLRTRNAINRSVLNSEEDYPVFKCFRSGLEFLQRNRDADNWLLQIEAFDPHEPFDAPARFHRPPVTGDAPILDWPFYQRVTETEAEIAEIRGHYAALVRMCDEQFGRLMECMDELDLWRDTCVVLTTDHGYLLSEHDWWAKNRMPYYEEISHIPLVVWHPDHAEAAGRRSAVTQTPDLMPTFLGLHDVDSPEEVTGRSILPLLANDDHTVRNVIFGMFAGPIGITDGRFAYYLYPHLLDGSGFNEYTLAPSRMMGPFEIEELQNLSLAEPFDFTKGARVLRVPSWPGAKRPPSDQKGGLADAQTVLFDLDTDPKQLAPLCSGEVEDRLKGEILRQLRLHDTPSEFFNLYPFGDPEGVAVAANF
jgi:arylsulfatase A-like enzyme